MLTRSFRLHFTRQYLRGSIAGLLVLLLASGLSCLRPWIRDTAVPLDRNDLPVRVTQLRGALYVVEDFNYWKTNQVFYAHDDGIYFVDSGWTYKSARQIIWKAAASSFGDFRSVILTGFPLHRTGGLSTFRAQGIKVVAHRSTRGLLQKHWESMHQEMAASFDSWRKLPLPEPDGVFDQEARMLGGRIRVLHMPAAYTPDNSVVLFPEERVLYAGSLLADPLVLTDFADWSAYERVLDRIERLEFDTIVSGHGRAVRDRSLLAELRRTIQDRRRAAAVSR